MMGAGSITVVFWGVPLPDDRADIAYGLIGGGHRIALPGDVQEPPGYHTSMPYDPRNGRHWIGIRVAELPPLPKSMRDRVFCASEAAKEVDLPSFETARGRAVAAWAHFADWCTRRGWTPPDPGLYVVADYD